MTPGRARALAWAAGLVAALTILALWFGSRAQRPREVVVPELSVVAQAGKEAFDRSCAQCHGQDAGGSAQGPPLVHPVYQPGHHADIAFDLAVRRGVRAHHWRFGDMPAQPALPPEELAQITRYVRELQQANGIY